MDSLILRHFELLNEYTTLQHELGQEAKEAFILLSRARYNDIKLSTDRFRPEMKCFVNVKPQEPLIEKHVADSASIKENDIELSHEAIEGSKDDEMIHSQQIGMLSNTLAKTAIVPTEAACEEDDDNNDLLPAEDQVFRLHELNISTRKGDNPIRSIETLPSSSLRSTQAAFQAMLGTTVKLADCFAELQIAQSLLGLHSSPLDENTGNKQEIESNESDDKETLEVEK